MTKWATITLQTYDSVKLFLASVNVSRRDEDSKFEITEDNARKVAHLCIAFGGLPLMLCMAGSWVDELSIEEVCRTLLSGNIQELNYSFYKDDRHVSIAQVSINEVIRWSYEQLEPNAKKLFRRLVFFVSRCTKEVAAKVCKLNDLPTDDASFTNIILTLKKHHFITYKEGRITIAHFSLRLFAIGIMEEEDGNIIGNKLIENFISYYNSKIAEFIVLKYYYSKNDDELEEYYSFIEYEKLNIIITYLLMHQLESFYRPKLNWFEKLYYKSLRPASELSDSDLSYFVKALKNSGKFLEKHKDNFVTKFIIWNIFLKDTLSWTEEELLKLRATVSDLPSRELF